MIALINRQRKVPVDERWLTALAKEVIAILEYEEFALGILITTNKTIQHYNETYRHKKGPTDVLSFAYYPDHVPGSRIQALDDEKNLGDLILSAEYIVNSAKALGVTFEHRLMILVIHSICHLLGYDHETDQQYLVMQALEDEILSKLPTKLVR